MGGGRQEFGFSRAGEGGGDGLREVSRLVPIIFGGGTGSEVMQRIAAPMVGGMLTAPMLSMLVVPALYRLMRRRREG